MTEEQWLRCTEPILMLEHLRDSGTPSERKLRLFAAACCRRGWHLLNASGWAAIETSERFAEGLVSQQELMAAVWAHQNREVHTRNAIDAAVVGAWRPAVALLTVVCAEPPSSPEALAREAAVQITLLRDVLGNPFRPPPPPLVLPEWSDSIISRMATSLYAERLLPSGHLDAERLAVLCDALLDAGCPEDHELLAHFRSPGPHVRGCFAIDLLTGKE
jgi:hypothetical protein